MGISLNTAIGLAFDAMLPAAVVWTALSLRVWRQARTTYRLAVTAFLGMTAVNIVDFIRLRHGVVVGPLAPDTVSAPVLVLRWLWAASFWWATAVLYGHFLPPLWRRLTGRPGPEPSADPYLAAHSIARNRARRVNALAERLRQIADELRDISERVESDGPLLLPRDDRRKETL